MPTGKGPLRIAIEDFIDGFKVGDRIENWLDAKGNKLKEGGFRTAWTTIYNQLGIEPKVPPLFSGNSPHALLALPALIPMLIGAFIGLGFSFISVLIQPIALRAQYQVNHKWGAYRIGARELTQLLKLFPEKSDDWLAFLLDLGVEEKTLNGLQALNRQFLNALQYVALWRRKQMSETELSNKLKQLGFLETDVDWLKQLTEIIPTPNDLILMAVREAFDDEFSNRFRHDEGISGEFIEWAKRQGLGEEWSKRYWRAHWQLPSPSQVFEMLHRLRPGKTSNTISAGDVDGYLKAADYSPFWRDRLKEISYSPFTRVDVRRMYKVGVLSEAEVKEAYLDLGYDDKKAQSLTEFTIAYEAEEETGIVRSSVLNAYGDGMIDRGTAESMLSAGGYDATTIAFYLDNVDFKEALEISQIKLTNIKKRFIEGLIDETTVNNEINTLNLPAERVTALLALWLTERENQIALPSLSQIENFYELAIVTLDDFKRILKRRGYSDETINWNVQRIDIEKADKAQKEAEKAEADNERLQKSTKASQYQKDKAEIDLSISQAKAEITDIDIALHGEFNQADIRILMDRKLTLQQDISDTQIIIADNKAQIVAIDIQLQDETDETVIPELIDRKNELKQSTADLNVIIQELQSEIVSIDAALQGVLTDEQSLELTARKVELKSLIGQLNIAKAKLRFDVTTAINELVGKSG